MLYLADNGLAAMADGDMLHDNALLAFGAVDLERLHLGCECAGEAVHLLLVTRLAYRLAALGVSGSCTNEGAMRHRHLRRKYCLNLVLGLYALKDSQTEIKRVTIVLCCRSGIAGSGREHQLVYKAVKKISVAYPAYRSMQ